MFSFFRNVLNLFEIENEFELAYLHGNGVHLFSQIYNKQKSSLDGFLLSFFRFIRMLFRNISLSNRKKNTSSDVMFFSDTINQLNTSIPVFNKLIEKKISCVHLSTKIKSEEVDSMSISIADSIFSIFLVLTKGVIVYLKILMQDKNKVRYKLNYLVFYWSSYFYCVLFYRYLMNSDVKFVVLSNDHNVENRSLRLVCEYLGIETIYIQHATTPQNFPPLNFDYAFLDGQVSFENYSNTQGTTLVTKDTAIYLSGMLKPQKLFSNSDKNYLGIAINLYDDINFVLDFLFGLDSDYDCIVRTHPAQSVGDVNKLKESGLEVSEGSLESTSDFFSKISVLVAGNSSIHLEASSSGIATFYYEFGASSIKSDYYGFVKNGLSKDRNQSLDLRVDIDMCVRDKDNYERILAIRKYNASYLTLWQGNEHELVANLIISIIKKTPNDNFFNTGLYFEIRN